MYQINILGTLNLYDVMCQLYLKGGRKGEREGGIDRRMQRGIEGMVGEGGEAGREDGRKGVRPRASKVTKRAISDRSRGGRLPSTHSMLRSRLRLSHHLHRPGRNLAMLTHISPCLPHTTPL